MKKHTIIKSTIRLSILFLFAAVIFTSCKKDKDTTGEMDYSTISAQTKDEAAIEDAINETTAEAEAFLSYSNTGGSKSGINLPCSVTVDSTQVNNDTIAIFLNYNGLSCDEKFFRTGKVEIRKKKGSWFFMPGAAVQLRYVNFTVKRVDDTLTLTFNGNHKFTNVTGGHLFGLGTLQDEIIHKLEGHMNVSFKGNVIRQWNVARQVMYSGVWDAYRLAISGFGTADGYDNLVTWGNIRTGDKFYSRITSPVVFEQTCEWLPVAGGKFTDIPDLDISALVSFGYGDDLLPINDDECPTFYKIDWQNGSFTGTRFIPLR
jgi:hypothetical protein